MTRHWSPLAVLYLVLAVIGLVVTFALNIATVVLMRDFFADITVGGPAAASLNVDLLVTAVAGAIFIVVESRRLGMRFGWLYVVAAGVTAFAFVFPLFLANRQRRLNAEAAGPRASTGSA